MKPPEKAFMYGVSFPVTRDSIELETVTNEEDVPTLFPVSAIKGIWITTRRITEAQCHQRLGIRGHHCTRTCRAPIIAPHSAGGHTVEVRSGDVYPGDGCTYSAAAMTAANRPTSNMDVLPGERDSQSPIHF